MTEIKFYWGSNYLALPRDPQPWLIDKLIPAAGATNLFGKPKLGKSFAALGIAIAIADERQTEWLGHKVLKHGKVVYLQVDTPREEWASRIEKIKAHTQMDIEQIAFTDCNLVPYPFNINVDDIKAQLKEFICTHKPLLLVVDTLREVHDGDENDSKEMKKVITSLVETTKDSNTALLLISHSRKDSMQFGQGTKNGADSGDDESVDNIMDDGRGSSYVSGRMDMVAKLTPKNLLFKGRSGKMKIAVEQDKKSHMIVVDKEKSENEAQIKYVLSQEALTTDTARGELLAALAHIKPEAARSRIRAYREKYKLDEEVEGDGDDESKSKQKQKQ